MVAATWSNCTLLLLVLTWADVATSRKVYHSPFKSFPMLYFSEQDKVPLQSKSSDTHEKIARDILSAGQELKKRADFFLPPVEHSVFASRWNEVYGNNLCAFSMYCFLYPQDTEALNIVRKFMDTMASYPDWYVASSFQIDEVPIGHSLYGFVTAFDILHDKFDPGRLRKYKATIKKHSLALFSMLSNNRHGWSRQYIHNHAATNIVALLMGGLVTSVSETDVASPWITESIQHLEMAMEILKHVTDGSLDEGVSYGSYSSRGLTTYLYLAKRHFGIDHSSNPWLKEHFWFYHRTLLPGFQRAVGIGDANHNWFFGPCSQLVYLDNYVLRNGYGNWLADKIRSARPKNKPLAPSNAAIYSTLHTEYIFYDASIPPRQPSRCDGSKLHSFSDWGVVTYGAGELMKTGNTFLSFKAGVANGEAVENIRLNNEYPSRISGWKNFNPGHEHPDQNSFTFAPNGRYFITEALYGPKLTILDNTYSFAPSAESKCNEPWEGQIGECSKWLKAKELLPGARAEILTAATSEQMVFVAGEAGAMYGGSLGIASFFRGVLLVNPEVLVVVDSIKLQPGSKTKLASATFHNMLHAFKPYKFYDYKGAQVSYPEGSYKMFTINIIGKPGETTLHEGFQPENLREGPTNYVNVTFPLERDVTTVAHVFSGPRYAIKSSSALKNSAGVMIRLEIGGIRHEVNISTRTKSWSKKITAVRDRIRFLGHAGYATVRVGSQSHYFGYQDKSNLGTPTSTMQSIPDNDKQVSKVKLRYTMADLRCQRIVKKMPAHLSKVANATWFHHCGSALVMALTGLSLISMAVLVLPQKKVFFIRKIRTNASTMTKAALILSLLISINWYCIESDGSNVCVAGGDVVEHLFGSTRDFLVLPSSEEGLRVPVQGAESMNPDLCLWSLENSEIGVISSGWLTSVILRPSLHFNQVPQSAPVQRIMRQIREHPSTTLAFFDNHGFWMTKMPWIQSIVGPDNLLSVLVVRDPRSWIHAITTDTDRQRKERTLTSLLKAYGGMQDSCKKIGMKPPIVTDIRLPTDSAMTLSDKLAIVWAVTLSNALASSRDLARPLHVVKFEDLVKQTEDASSDLFRKLGFPLGTKQMSNVTRLMRSTHYKTRYDGVITPSTLDMWRVNLSPSVSRRISLICCPVMEKLGYDCGLT